MSATQITTHVQEAIALLASAFSQSADLQAILSAFIAQVQDLEDDLYAMIVERTLATAVGAQLDQVGKIIGRTRAAFSLDADYRVALTAQVQANKAQGTTDEILATIAPIVGDTVIYTQIDRACYLLEWVRDAQQTSAFVALIQDLVALMSPAGVRYQAIELYSDPGPAFRFDDVGSGFDQGLFQRYAIADSGGSGQ